MESDPVDLRPLEPAREDQSADPIEESTFVDTSMQDTPAEPAQVYLQPETSRREPFWGYGDVAIVLGLLFASMALMLLIAGGFMVALPGLRRDPTPLLLPTQMAFYGLVWASFAIDFRTRYHKSAFPSLGWRRTKLNLLWMVAGGIVLALVLSAFGDLIHTPKVETPFDQLLNTPLSFALLAITAVILAPIFEELFFRGFLQPLLSRTFGVVAGILITAGLFGALHSFEYAKAWQYPLTISLAGVAFGYMRWRMNSIIPGVVMHGCFNAVSVIAMGVQKYHK
jgi:membrane protease YdiL (CAAX protease family)